MPLDIIVYPIDSESISQSFEDVDYLSFINDETYGKPPIVAPGTEGYNQGQETRVLYVNPAHIYAIDVEKR